MDLNGGAYYGFRECGVLNWHLIQANGMFRLGFSFGSIRFNHGGQRASRTIESALLNVFGETSNEIRRGAERLRKVKPLCRLLGFGSLRSRTILISNSSVLSVVSVVGFSRE